MYLYGCNIMCVSVCLFLYVNKLCMCFFEYIIFFTNFRVSEGFPYWCHRCFYRCTIMYNFFKLKKTQKIKNRFIHKEIQNDIKYKN